MDNLVVFKEEAIFSGDDNFFEMGFVNSLFAMKLVEFIEEEFNFDVDNEELNEDNFFSINSIESFVTAKLRCPGAVILPGEKRSQNLCCQ